MSSRILPALRPCRGSLVSRFALACIAGAALALGLSVADATANTLAMSDGEFRFAWSRLSWTTSISRTTCSVTLEGSLHDTRFTKEVGQLIGHITSATVGECSGGSATLLRETLPWHLTYEGFSGRLPEITAIAVEIKGLSVLFSTGFGNCLFETSAEEPAGGILTTSEGVITEYVSEEESEIDLDTPTFLCEIAGDSTFSGTAEVSNGSEEALAVTLSDVPDRDAGVLTASPSSVSVEALEESERFTVTNTGSGDHPQPVTIDGITYSGINVESPEFEVSSPGCPGTLAHRGSCVYTVMVNGRPVTEGRVIFEYDNGVGGNARTTVEVDIAGEDDEARLEATPTGVTIEALEQSGIVAMRNNGGGDTATIDNVTVATTDSESPEFTVITSACRSTLADDETCHYLISVNSRPERAGSITVEYDDGDGGARRLVIEVDIAGPDPAELRAEPTEVVIERLESNDSFVLRNISPDTAAVVNEAILSADDRERPEFSVTGIGCPEIYVAGASCTYVVSVNSRPETDGTYTIEYDDGAGEDREVTVRVAIES